MATKKAAPKTVNKSSITGQFVTDEYLKKNPNTTFKETVKPAPKKKSK